MYITPAEQWQSHVVDVDPFWYSIYRPLFLDQLEQRCKSTGGHRLHGVLDIHTYLQEGVDTCANASRSEARRFLIKVQSELFDRDLWNDSKVHLKYLMGMLRDIDGKQIVINDTHFFSNLRDTFYRADETSQCVTLDRYLWNTMYFLNIDEQKWSENGIPINELCDVRSGATFSSHAIKRFYHRKKWDTMTSIPMSSRIALCYRWYDPLDVMRYSDQHGARCTPYSADANHDVHPRRTVSIADQLAHLLTPFAGRLGHGLNGEFIRVFIHQSDINDIGPSTIRTNRGTTGIDDCTVVTACEIPADPGSTMNPANNNCSDIREINMKAVRDQNICIRVNDWLNGDVFVFNVARKRDYGLTWIVSGVKLCYYMHRGLKYCLDLRLENVSRSSNIQFLPMWGGMPTDTHMDPNRRVVDHVAL